MNSALIALAIRSTVLLSFGFLLSGMLGKSSAATRNAIWRLTLLGLILLPVMLIRLPTWGVPVERVPLVSRAIELTQPPIANRVGPSLSASSQTKHQNHEVTPIEKPVDWPTVALWAWVGLSISTLLPLLIGLSGLVRTLYRSKPIDGPEFAALCMALGLSSRVSLRISKDIQTPATAGVFRPVVLLPEAALEWGKDRLEMVLRHELAHVQRGDWIARIASHLACAFYAPNPLVWIASAKMRAESEAACDDLVIAGGVSAKAYAQELLIIARSVRRSSLGIATVGMAHRPNVESRLRAIVDPHRRRGQVSRRAFISLSLCGLITAGLIASFRILSSQQPPANKAITSSDQRMDEFLKGIRDDVSDHPTISPIEKGARFTVEPFEPPASHVMVARNGVARLPNGVTVSLEGISPTATTDPIWGFSNQTVDHLRMDQNRTFGGFGQHVEALDRSLFFSITSPNSAIASTMGYLYKPKSPESIEVHGVSYGAYGRDTKSNSFHLGPDSLHAVQLLIPGKPSIDHVTYRIGISTGEWKTVMDVPNPYHRKPDPAAAMIKNNGGGVEFQGIPCIIGPLELGKKLPRNDRFVGEVNSSDLVARRALILDEKGDLIRGEVSQMVGWYPLSYNDICRCTHVVIQERQFEWAEFREIPLRPNLERDAKKAGGTLIEGTATGIAPGFEKSIPGIGTVSIASVVTARMQGSSWTEDDQPQWRADGKVLAESNGASGPGAIQVSPQTNSMGAPNNPATTNAPTTIHLQYAGSAWHKVNSRLRIEGEQVDYPPMQPDATYQITRIFDKSVDQVNVLLDIADGPWKIVDTKPISIPTLPDADPKNRDNLSSGVILFDGDNPWMVVLKSPVDMGTATDPPKVIFSTLPKGSCHRFVAVLKDGTEIQLLRGFTIPIPGRKGENPSLESYNNMVGKRNFLANEVKEIRLETRPVSRTVRFDHVAVKPKQ